MRSAAMIRLVPVLAALAAGLAAAEDPATQPVEDPDTFWKVSCRIDEMDDHRTCYLAAAADEGEGHFVHLLTVIIVRSDPPIVVAGTPDYPGERETTIRVDANKAVSFSPRYQTAAELKVARQQSKTLLAQFAKGKTARLKWSQWPSGDQRGVLPLAGFVAAHAELVRQLRQQGETSWEVYLRH